jgi:hypothetical protein
MNLENQYSRSGHSGASIDVNGKFVLVNNGYINNRVDYIVIREFEFNDVDGRLSDKRYVVDDFAAYVETPEGCMLPIRDTNMLYFITDNEILEYKICLKVLDMFMVHGEKHKSIEELIKKLCNKGHSDE